MGSIFMRKDKFLAIKLRKKGNSYSQISEELNIPKSTLSYWLNNLEISAQAQEKISLRSHKLSTEGLIRRNINQTHLASERAEEIRIAAKKESNKFLNDTLFVSGISLYWAEGYKKGAEGSKWKSVDFANADPEMISLVMMFFRKFLVIDDAKFRVQLMVHENVDVEKAVAFWSKLTKLPKKQFFKSSLIINKSSQGKRKSNSLTYGTVHIRINDVKLFFRLIGWIDGFKEKFNQAGIV